jgi:uracil-DNA glycosylase family 4
MGRVDLGIQSCRRCERAGTRVHAVPGKGQLDSKIMLLGEAPGKRENQTGEPFVGRAGTYLDKIFRFYSIERDVFFITSILKCYHPESPKKAQIESCLQWTEKQMEILRPEMVLIMGKTAESGLFGKSGRHHGSVLEWKGISCVVTRHPAAAMRFPQYHEQFNRDFSLFVRLAIEKGLLE